MTQATSSYLNRPLRTEAQARASMRYRVYCNGQEFGIDYPTLSAAQDAKRAYERYFPALRYHIRKCL